MLSPSSVPSPGTRDWYVGRMHSASECPAANTTNCLYVFFYAQLLHYKDYPQSILAVVSVCQWFKILYFFRAFESTGPLVSMIFGILFDVRYFFLILGIILFGFSQAFWLISFNVQTVTQPLSARIYEESEAVVGEVPSDEISSVGGGGESNMVLGYHTWYTSVLQVR
jgi:hypothetical protein